MINRAEIRGRMRSIEQTRQITRAMHLLSATKVKRDAHWVELTRTYFRRVRSSMRDTLEKSKGVEHRYLQPRDGGRAAYVVIAGDKGLAGGYNHSVLNYALNEIKRNDCRQLITIGQVTRSFFESRGYTVNSEYVEAGQRPYLHHARRIIEYIFQMYDDNEIDEIYVIYTRYDSAISQFPQTIKLLPITLFDYKKFDLEYDYSGEILYEPSPQAVFDTLVPEFAIGLLFGGMVQSYVSEHTARMNAMDSATHNADDMLSDLSLRYNMARQYAITQEITEISGAAEALSDGR